MKIIQARSDLKPNDILFTSIGRIGDCYLIKKQPNNWNINESVFTLRPNQLLVEPEYLFHTIHSEKVLKQILGDVTGSTFKSIKIGDLKKTNVPITSKKEQLLLAKFLTNIEDTITLHQRKLGLLKDLKNSLLAKMFPADNEKAPKIRFKGYTEVWEQRKLSDVCVFLKGNGLSWNDISDEGIHECILYGNLYTDYGMIADKVVCKTNSSSPSFLQSKKYDVLIPGDDTTPAGLARATSLEVDGVILGGGINVLRSDMLNGSFLSLSLNRNKHKMIPLITGTTRLRNLKT